MPKSKHYGGHGGKVWRSMVKTYGNTKRAERIFYATENARKKGRKGGRRRRPR
jgi:hypothetical protein